MRRDVVTNNRMSQLPMILSGIFYKEAFNGTAMPFFIQQEHDKRSDSSPSH